MYLCSQKIISKVTSSSGVTLIELMVSLFIFAIGMLAVTAMCLMSIHGNSLTNQMTQANFLAQSEMEELLSDDKTTLCGYAIDGMPSYDNLNFHVAPNVIVNSTPSYNTAILCDPSYNPPTIPLCLDDDHDPRCDFRITVVVDWVDSKGNHDFELKTLSSVH